jgi:hypothetical protein
VLEQTRLRTLPLVSRTADVAPAAQACCGVCRTCATTNVLALAAAGGSALVAGLLRLVRRRA